MLRMVPSCGAIALSLHASRLVLHTGMSHFRGETKFSSRVGINGFRGPRILRWKMCKKAMCVIVLLLGGTWVQAQQSQPGYAVLSSDQGSGRLGTSLIGAGPPEPAALGGAAPPAGVAYPAAPGLAYPAAPPGMPMMPGPGMTGPAPGMMAGPGPGMAGPGPGAIMGPPAEGWSNPVGQFMQVGPANTLGSETYWVNLGYVAGWMTKPRLGAPLITEGSTTDAHPGALNQPTKYCGGVWRRQLQVRHLPRPSRRSRRQPERPVLPGSECPGVPFATR
jgi:hypothetical protein